jgi:hypothetical protein
MYCTHGNQKESCLICAIEKLGDRVNGCIEEMCETIDDLGQACDV